MSFSDYYKKWKEDNNVTEEIEYNPNLTQAERNEFIEQSMNRRIEDVTNRIRQANANRTQTSNNSTNNNQSIWDKIGFVMNRFGTGVHQGTAGIAQGLLTDSANEMQKGKQKDNKELLNNFINAYAGNDLHHIAQSTLNTINEGINIINDKDKNLWQKMVDLNLNAISNGAKALAPMQGFYSSANQILGKATDTDQQLLEMNKNISEPLEERQKELANEGEKYDGTTKFLGEAGQVIGNMIPSITASAITKNPSVALGVMGASVKGQATQEALDKGMSLDKATQIGDAKALIEVATEKLSGGTKVFGHGSLDDIAEELVKKGAKSKAGKFIMTQLLNAGGEIAEEEISNVLGNAIDKGTTDPDKKVLDMKEAFETMGSTAFTTTMLNLLTGGMVNDYRQISNNMNQYKDANTGEILDNSAQDVLKQAENIINESNTPNLQQQSTQNEQNILTQQINQEQNNVAQNENINEFNGYTDKEINNIESNKITVAKSNEDIINFVNSSKKVPSNRKMYLGKIKENISNYINEKFGINIGNYNISLKTDAIRHTENNHTNLEKETSRGQIPLVAEDYANIPVIINNPDNVSIDGKTQQGKPVIKFEKNIDGNNVVVTYVSDKHNNLELQTMYKFKNNKKMNPATASNELNSLNRTSETNSGTDSFIDNSIPPISNKVNSDTITNNYTQSNENNTQNKPTKGETINWNEIERPEGKIRKHYRSIIESSNTTKEAKAIAKEMMGLDTYTPQSNESLLQKADSRISTTNPETELNSLLSRVMNNEKVNDVDMAVGERLIEYYSKIGDSEHLQDAIHATALAGTQAGRTVQAMALLNHMTPQGQVVWLERSVNKANKELEQKFKNKKNIPQFELTSEMTEKILNTKSKEEMYKVLDDVYEELGQQVPKTTLEKIDEWRYFSMLANVKTHGRNMIGNFAMNLTQRTKNKVAGAIEGTVAKFNPKMERTHTIVPTSKKVKEFAKNDVKNMDVQTELGMNENKYNPQSRLQSARRTFKSDILENTLGKMFDLNSNLLEVEDNIGLKSMYVKSLGEYITANKIDIDNMTDAQLSKARQHAIKEAQEATFHQASALATALNQMGRKNNITKFALDSAVPFKKTPINVAKTGVQYSPVGLIKSAVYDVRKVRKGNMSINQYIDNVSKGLTGTGITFLGYVLAEAGILKASGEDDDKKEKYDEEQGKQTYSIEIGGKTATLDWLSPVGIPLFIGAEINQQFNTTKKEKNSKSNDDEEKLNQIIKGVADIANASANAINPMSEMSMISGLTSVLSSYNKENAVGDMIVNTGKSYINQFVPTLMSQIARTTDDYERTTKSTKTGTLEKAVDSTINQVKSKIPGLRQTLPVRTDIWGKKVEQSQNIPIRALNNFINPSNIKEISTSQVDEELNKFYIKTGENSILPKAIEKKYTIDGTDYTMTNEEYAKYNKKYGETSYKLIQDLINSKDYKELTDNQKQKAIESVYSYAKESNKIEYANDNKLDVEQSTLYKTLTQLKNDGGNLSDYLEYIGKIDGIKGEGEGKKKIGILAESNYSDKTKEIIYKNTEGSKDSKVEYLVDKLGFPIQQYLRYRQQDFENDKNEYNETIKGSKKQKVLNYLNTIPDSRLSMEYKKIICQMENNSDYAGDVARFINNSNKLTSDEKTSLLKKMNFEIDRYGNIKNKIMLPISKNIK